MKREDYSGKRVRYKGRVWLAEAGHPGPVQTVVLNETGRPEGHHPQVLVVPEHRWHELLILLDEDSSVSTKREATPAAS